MGKTLEEVLKRELGFGEKRIEKFMSAYNEVAATIEHEEPETIISNPACKAFSHHAKARYVERVIGLELLEANMNGYIRDHNDLIMNDLESMYNKSHYLLSRSAKYRPSNGEVVETTRGYFISDGYIIVMDEPTGKMVTLCDKIAFNLPKSLEEVMIETITDEVIRLREKLEITQHQEAYMLEHRKKQVSHLMKQREELDMQITACQIEVQKELKRQELHKQELYETAKYLINNDKFREDGIL